MSDNWNNNDWDSSKDWDDNLINNENIQKSISGHQNDSSTGSDWHDNTNWNNAQQDKAVEQSSKGSKDDSRTSWAFKLVGLFFMVVILASVLILVKVTKRGSHAIHDPKPKQELVQSSSSLPSVSENSSSSSVTKVSSSEKSVSENLGGSEVKSTESSSKNEVIVNPKLGDVRSGQATIEGIDLVSEEGLLAQYHVKLKMGRTHLTLLLDYGQAHDLRVGDKLTVTFRQVEGMEKVVIESLQKASS